MSSLRRRVAVAETSGLSFREDARSHDSNACTSVPRAQAQRTPTGQRRGNLSTPFESRSSFNGHPEKKDDTTTSTLPPSPLLPLDIPALQTGPVRALACADQISIQFASNQPDTDTPHESLKPDSSGEARDSDQATFSQHRARRLDGFCQTVPIMGWNCATVNSSWAFSRHRPHRMARPLETLFHLAGSLGSLSLPGTALAQSEFQG